jgi:hypothetical protein
MNSPASGALEVPGARLHHETRGAGHAEAVATGCDTLVSIDGWGAAQTGQLCEGTLSGWRTAPGS